MAEARIDKWMWAVRIFKTRTIAAEACKKGRVTINGALVKAARMVKPGDVIQVKKPPITYSFNSHWPERFYRCLYREYPAPVRHNS